MNWVYLALAVIGFFEFSQLVSNLGHMASGLHRIANSYDIWAASMVIYPSEAEKEAAKTTIEDFTRRMLDETTPPGDSDKVV